MMQEARESIAKLAGSSENTGCAIAADGCKQGGRAGE